LDAGRAYREQREAIEVLAKSVGFDVAARAYFLGEATVLYDAIREKVGASAWAAFQAAIHGEPPDWSAGIEALRGAKP